MSSPVIVPPYLITSRKFSFDLSILDTTLSKMYFDIATAVNYREIAIYDRFNVTTGQQWYNDANIQKRRQAFRQIYTLNTIISGLNTIPTEINMKNLDQFVHIYGVAESPTEALPIPYINVANPADSIQLKVNKTSGEIEINTTTANYATYSALIVLEYILNS